MTLGGWINLTLSVGSVAVLFVWCLTRVLRQPPEKVKHLAHVEAIDEETVDER
jgi:hypothetical protein